MPLSKARLSFIVYGIPGPQGSKRHVGKGIMVESSKKVAPWREDVRQAAIAAMSLTPSWSPVAGHVVMHIVFVLPRPKAHYRTGRNAGELKPNAPHFVRTKPDLDKLLRSTGDALTSAGVYTDDSRVVAIHASKVYDDRPGARVILEAYE